MRRRKEIRQPGDPNFLFSLPPFVTPGTISTIVVEPTGGDDTPNIQAAVNRLTAISGGVLRFSAGNFASDAFYVEDSMVVF